MIYRQEGYIKSNDPEETRRISEPMMSRHIHEPDHHQENGCDPRAYTQKIAQETGESTAYEAYIKSKESAQSNRTECEEKQSSELVLTACHCLYRAAFAHCVLFRASAPSWLPLLAPYFIVSVLSL